MIKKITIHPNSNGKEIPVNITMGHLKELLYNDACIKETTVGSEYYRVFFAWSGRLYVRAIRDPLAYIQSLPINLRDASELDDYHLAAVLRSYTRGSVSLSIMAHKGNTIDVEKSSSVYLSPLKDFK